MSGNVENAKLGELTADQLDLVSGGVSLSFTRIEFTYTQQHTRLSSPTARQMRRHEGVNFGSHVSIRWREAWVPSLPFGRLPLYLHARERTAGLAMVRHGS